MKYPCLVPRDLCKVKVDVEIDQESINEYGEPYEPFKWSGRCNYQDAAKTIWDDQKKRVRISGRALIPGDIVPKMAVISGGTVVLFGERRRIVNGRKNRNPDGTVNFTELELE